VETTATATFGEILHLVTFICGNIFGNGSIMVDMTWPAMPNLVRFEYEYIDKEKYPETYNQICKIKDALEQRKLIEKRRGGSLGLGYGN